MNRNADDLPDRGGRGAYDGDALGASTVKISITGGSPVVLRWPIAGMYFDWIKTRGTEDTLQ